MPGSIVKKPPTKKSPAKKSPTKKSPAKKSPVKKTMSKNAKVAAGVAAALALAGAAGYGAYKVKQRRDLQSEQAVVDYSKSSIMRIISMIKAKANEARQKIIERFKKNTITMAKAEEDMKQVAKEEEKAIKQVVPEADYL